MKIVIHDFGTNGVAVWVDNDSRLVKDAPRDLDDAFALARQMMAEASGSMTLETRCEGALAHSTSEWDRVSRAWCRPLDAECAG